MSRTRAQAVEIFAARQHFDYTSREHLRELGSWFRQNSLDPFSMHAPLHADREMGRGRGRDQRAGPGEVAAD